MFRERMKAPTFSEKKLFAGLPDSACRQIMSTARPKSFMKGDYIFLDGDPAEEVFLLTRGRVQMTNVSESGKEVILRFNIPGDLIGSPEMDSEARYHSTAQAIQESKTIVWDASTFRAALGCFPILERNVQEIVARHIREMEEKICEVSTAKASTRLALELVRLVRQIGRKSNGYAEVALPHESLAEMSGTTQFNVSRILCQWQEQGVVSVGRGIVRVRSYDGLKHLCQEPKSKRTDLVPKTGQE